MENLFCIFWRISWWMLNFMRFNINLVFRKSQINNSSDSNLANKISIFLQQKKFPCPVFVCIFLTLEQNLVENFIFLFLKKCYGQRNKILAEMCFWHVCFRFFFSWLTKSSDIFQQTYIPIHTIMDLNQW